jgi:phosphoglycolate phosphatase
MIEEGLRRAGASDDVDRMLDEFLAHYEANIAAESRPFPGAVVALQGLAAAGAKLALCTNKRERLTLKLLEALSLTGYFDAVAGRDTFAVSKPHPDHLIGVIARAGGDPARAVMVGDSEIDLATAKAARVKAVLVSFGYAGEPFDALAPDAVIDHFDELERRAEVLLRSSNA